VKTKRKKGENDKEKSEGKERKRGQGMEERTQDWTQSHALQFLNLGSYNERQTERSTW